MCVHVAGCCCAVVALELLDRGAKEGEKLPTVETLLTTTTNTPHQHCHPCTQEMWTQVSN